MSIIQQESFPWLPEAAKNSWTPESSQNRNLPPGPLLPPLDYVFKALRVSATLAHAQDIPLLAGMASALGWLIFASLLARLVQSWVIPVCICRHHRCHHHHHYQFHFFY